jgi:hypothetical protein
MKQKGKIKDWELIRSYPNHYQLVGEITDHPDKPEFQTGRQITSTLKSIDFVNKTAETRNTIYELVDEDENFSQIK